MFGGLEDIVWTNILNLRYDLDLDAEIHFCFLQGTLAGLWWRTIRPSLVAQKSAEDRKCHILIIRTIAVSLALKTVNIFFSRKTLAYDDASPYHVWYENIVRFRRYYLETVFIVNLRCNSDHERSNPFFSPQDTPAYNADYQAKFGYKRTASLGNIIESPCCDLDLEDSKQVLRLMMTHHYTKFG